MPRSVDQLLDDIAVRAHELDVLVQAETRESFLQSRFLQAVKQEPSLTWQITETQKIIALRHLLIHHYHKVSPLAIWDTSLRNVPWLAHEIANWRVRQSAL